MKAANSYTKKKKINEHSSTPANVFPTRRAICDCWLSNCWWVYRSCLGRNKIVTVYFIRMWKYPVSCSFHIVVSVLQSLNTLWATESHRLEHSNAFFIGFKASYKLNDVCVSKIDLVTIKGNRLTRYSSGQRSKEVWVIHVFHDPLSSGFQTSSMSKCGSAFASNRWESHFR